MRNRLRILDSLKNRYKLKTIAKLGTSFFRNSPTQFRAFSSAPAHPPSKPSAAPPGSSGPPPKGKGREKHKLKGKTKKRTGSKEEFYVATAVNQPWFSGLKKIAVYPTGQNDIENQMKLVLLPLKPHSFDIQTEEDFYSVGTLAVVTKTSWMQNLIRNVEIEALETVEVVKFKDGLVSVKSFGDPDIKKLKYSDMSKQQQSAFVKLKILLDKIIVHRKNFKEITKMVSLDRVRVFQTVENIRAAIGFLFPNEIKDLINIFTEPKIDELMRKMLRFLEKMIELEEEYKSKAVASYFKNITDNIQKGSGVTVENQLNNSGQSDKDEKIDQIMENVRGKKMPANVKKAFDKQLDRYKASHKSEQETCIKVLETLSELPWNIFSEDKFDLEYAKKVMDESHYAMEEVKKRIIEYIACAKLKGGISKGKAICLIGPPGTGKTSIAKSIAKALNKKFQRIPLAGIDDPSTLNGNRRVFVGSYAGRLVNSIKDAQTFNPLILLDEIDKIHGNYKSKIVENVLLELFDKNQNKNFNDNFLDLGIDVSKVFFVCTANREQNIDPVILDRIEKIEVGGYISAEKLHIAKKYSIPEILRENKISSKTIYFEDDAIRYIINGYCREAGARQLHREIEKCVQKMAVKLVKREKSEFVVSKKEIKEMLGWPVYQDLDAKSDGVPGLANGLTVSDLGGHMSHIESQSIPLSKSKKDSESGSIKNTGNLSKVTCESTEIAFTVARHFLGRLKDPSESRDFFDKNDVHVHFPSGSAPKDGPSAGITYLCSLISLATNTPIKSQLAMTGELRLVGSIEAIGGVREKVIGAKNSGCKEVMMPWDNKHSWEELLPEVREGLTPHFVKTAEEALKIALPTLVFG